MGKLSVRNSYVLNSESVILPQPSKSTKVSKRDLLIFHQNIRGINNKMDKILNTIATNPPHVLCFTEHHLNSYQFDNILFQNNKLGANFCREMYKDGGVCIYIHESFQCSNINVYNFCKEKDLEVCVIKLYSPCCTVGMVNIYRSPSGNFENLLNEFETLLNTTSSNSMDLIICRDFNINF
jgi:exonuclease III